MLNNEIPTEDDWGDYRADSWAHDLYIGKTIEEMLPRFRTLPTSVFEDLDMMSDVCFQFYVFGYKLFLMSDEVFVKPVQPEAADGSSCFLDLIFRKLEKAPATILPVMEDLLPVAEFVTANQDRYGADPKIYGSYRDKLDTIKTLYASHSPL